MADIKVLRCGIRYLFSKKFWEHGALHSTSYLNVFKGSDYVDIRCDGSVQKGVPHKCYYGRIGKALSIQSMEVDARSMPEKFGYGLGAGFVPKDHSFNRVLDWLMSHINSNIHIIVSQIQITLTKECKKKQCLNQVSSVLFYSYAIRNSSNSIYFSEINAYNFR